MSETETVKATRGRPKTSRAERPKRVPMSGSRQRMKVDDEYKDPAFHYAWINDQKDLIHRAKRAGYEHVETSEMPFWGSTDSEASGSTSSIISMNVGKGVTGYLMKQPIEFYNEDRAEMDKVVDDRESDMKKTLNSGKDGTYGEVTIT